MMDREEIDKICASMPPNREKTRFDLSPKTLRALRETKKLLAEGKVNDYERAQLQRRYDKFMDTVRKLHNLLTHKAALIYKMGTDRKNLELEIELAEVDNALNQLSKAYDENSEAIHAVARKTIQTPQRLVSDQHWAQLSQKAKLSNATNRSNHAGEANR